jgi:hypothetical protein
MLQSYHAVRYADYFLSDPDHTRLNRFAFRLCATVAAGEQLSVIDTEMLLITYLNLGYLRLYHIYSTLTFSSATG